MVNRHKILKELEKYPVFTSKTLADIIGKEKTYANLVAHRLEKAGLIFRLEKDKYTMHEDPWIVASHIVWPSYISCWAALEYHHLTEQLAWRIDVITSRARKRKELKFANARIAFIRVKTELLFGFRKAYYRGFEIFVADKEKAVADSLILDKVSEGELSDIVKNHKRELNLQLIANYLKKMAAGSSPRRTINFVKLVGKNA